VHSELPLSENFPAAQTEHEEHEELPVVVLYCPELQHNVQDVLLEVELNFPPGQETHEIAPGSEYLPASQSVHASAPAAEYVPALQTAHADAPVAEYMPAAHVEHAVLRPVTELYVPAAHAEQLDCPAKVWYCPLAHDAHVDAVAAE